MRCCYASLPSGTEILYTATPPFAVKSLAMRTSNDDRLAAVTLFAGNPFQRSSSTILPVVGRLKWSVNCTRNRQNIATAKNQAL
jgi:hypothetical protein